MGTVGTNIKLIKIVLTVMTTSLIVFLFLMTMPVSGFFMYIFGILSHQFFVVRADDVYSIFKLCILLARSIQSE